jgi:hypothetical protein
VSLAEKALAANHFKFFMPVWEKGSGICCLPGQNLLRTEPVIPLVDSVLKQKKISQVCKTSKMNVFSIGPYTII